MKICIFSDTHYCSVKKMPDGRLCSKSLEKVNEIINYCKANNVNTLVCLGDLMHIEDDEILNKNNFHEMVSLIKGSGLEFILIPGNIDNRIMSRDGYEKESGFTLAPFVKDAENTRLIFLDASYSEDGKHYEPPMNDWQNSYIPENELEFLQKALEESEKPCIVFTHQCLDYSVERHHIIRNAVNVNRIIADSEKVKAVYSGHYHLGNKSEINGIEYITMHAVSLGEKNSYTVIDV